MKKGSSSGRLLLLGPEGSFSDQAADKLGGGPPRSAGGRQWKKKYAVSFGELFGRFEEGNFALVPARNKLVGQIKPVEDFLKKNKKEVKIVRRFRMRVSFVLASKKKIPLGEITDLYLPEIVHGQCKKFIDVNLSHARLHKSFDSTSSVFKKVVQLKRQTVATIGSLHAAKIYKLAVLAKNVQNDRTDWTEFVLLRIK